ncbi:O-antigen ligase family protein [Clostridium baratii]|uniref:O-antigen ligase family protein n=1 Tax=Clostridium baratii TaxID=1561 RepID=UPI0030CDA1E0
MYKKNSGWLMKFTLLNIFLTIILGNSSTFSIGSIFKGMPVKITEVVMIVNIFFLIIYFLNNKIYFKIRQQKILIIWCLIGAISIIVNAVIYNYAMNEIAYGGLYCIRFLLYILYTIYVSEFMIINNFTIYKLFKFLINCYLIVAILGIIQIIVWPIAVNFYSILSKMGVYLLNPDPHINRIISTYLDPNYLGAILIIPITLNLILLIKEKKKIRNLITLAILCSVLIGTVSRSALIGLVLSLIITFILIMIKLDSTKRILINKKMLILMYVLSIIIPIIVIINLDSSRLLQRIVMFKDDPSALARFTNWRYSLSIVDNNQLLGIGYNMLGFYTGNTESMTSFGVDASLLLVLITTGIIGLITYVSYYINIIKKCIYFIKKERYIFSALLGIIISSLVMSFFNNLLFYPLWMLPFFIVINFSINKEIKN